MFKHEIICLCESKVDEIDVITAQTIANKHQFCSFSKCRKGAKKKSGGLTTFISKKIEKYVREQIVDVEFAQCFVIDKELIRSSRDILLFNIYVPPRNSNFTNNHIYDEIENMLANVNFDNYHTLLAGDFNAHTSTINDFVLLEDILLEDLGIVNTEDILKTFNCNITRCNRDSSRCDTYGHNLIGLCKHTGLCIYNGRVNGDKHGQTTTCHNTTIDYIIGSPYLLENIVSFKVKDFDPLFSDVHCRLHLAFSAQTVQTETIQHKDVAKLNNWSKDKENAFRHNLDMNKITELENKCHQENIDINLITEDLSHVYSSAERTLGIKPSYNQRQTKTGNNTTKRLKRDYMKAANRLKHDKTTENVRRKRNALKKYQKEIKRYYGKQSKKFIHKLRQTKSTNSKVYWNMLNDHKQNVIKPNLEDLQQHFQTISNIAHTEEGNDTEQNTHYEVYDDNLLNAPISSDEIIKACSKLKDNKSPGGDNIVNEYIKASIPVMINVYTKLFNKILDSGVFPDAWSSGIIMPVYKNKGDRNNCNNYRGITLLSCIGKLFTSILNTRLQKYCDTNNIINETQAGFRKNYSTIDHIFSLRALIEILFSKGKKLYW